MPTALLLNNIQYRFDGKQEFQLERRYYGILAYEAVATLGKGDTFTEGIAKFARHFISPDDWKDRENAVKSITTHEPEPYKGTFSFDVMLRREHMVNVSGNFKIIRDLIF